ncbi:DUF2934 domain-containing protein [Prosthecomicrobium sp. N25]|uniref:DUF2934 domain-containing protein n=1 Tax=Prosthecomicrobium sp. N25 TaxID=3129254 RepID=UPI0030771298
MPGTEDDTERRIREKAHQLWEAEGRPHGRHDLHWEQAREMVAIEDSYEDTLRPVPTEGGEPVEPFIAIENQGEFPDLADQGEQVAAPDLRVAAEHADDRPETPPSAAPRRPPAASKAGNPKADAAGQFAKSRAIRDNDGLTSAVPVSANGDGDATRKPRRPR